VLFDCAAKNGSLIEQDGPVQGRLVDWTQLLLLIGALVAAVTYVVNELTTLTTALTRFVNGLVRLATALGRYLGTLERLWSRIARLRGRPRRPDRE
jgi:hypothetical protein